MHCVPWVGGVERGHYLHLNGETRRVWGDICSRGCFKHTSVVKGYR